MRSRLVGGVALALILGALTACGGEEGGPGAEKQSYIEQSDAICRETFQETSGLTARDQQTAERAAEVWGRATERLKPLPVPDESVELARQFVIDVENLSMTYTAAARALALNNQQKADRAFEDAAMIKARAAETADEYGYQECVRIGQA